MTAAIIGSCLIQAYNERLALDPLKHKNPKLVENEEPAGERNRYLGDLQRRRREIRSSDGL